MEINKFSELNNDINEDWITVEGKKPKHSFYTPKINPKSEFITNEKNQKKMLCNNMLKNKKCTYGNKCMYAHSLEEQNIDFLKKKAYDIIKSEENINLDLSKDDKLAKTFLQFTKLCNDCKNKVCPGGYNCKYGTMDEKYLICQEDLMSGICNKEDCPLVHLTRKGISPIIPNIKPKIELNRNKKKFTKDLVSGTVLNDEFFVTLNIGKNNINEEFDSDSESAESIEKMKEYFEEYDSDENCEKSIFIYKKIE